MDTQTGKMQAASAKPAKVKSSFLAGGLIEVIGGKTDSENRKIATAIEQRIVKEFGSRVAK